jgi:V8-like Glu-specific endopeptidase
MIVSILVLVFSLIIKIHSTEVPDDFHNAKDAIESKYYDEAMEYFIENRVGEAEEVGRKRGRVAGGERARIGQFPHQAVFYMRDSEGAYVCGGTLIRHKWVLTVSHSLQLQLLLS